METTFYEVICDYIQKAPLSEIGRIKDLIDCKLADTNTFEGKVRYMKLTKGVLSAVKFVKETNNWTLVESKAFVDSL